MVACESEVSRVDLVTPVMTDEAPVPGKRVRQTAPGYEGTEVYHALYLPTDWQPGGKFPVLVEYTGNRFPTSGSTGEVRHANLGYGLSGGESMIWVAMAYVEEGRQRNALTWWGDLEATLDYCKMTVPRICDEFGGDADNVFVCGFSRGALAVNYLGLADDAIAALWKGFIAHDHYDGVREWPYAGSDRHSALERLERLDGRPQLISQNGSTRATQNYLRPHAELGEFTFLDVPVDELFDIPEGQIIHPHTDLWMCKDSPYRRRAREWLADVIARP
jgi:hypothetical protein